MWPGSRIIHPSKKLNQTLNDRDSSLTTKTIFQTKQKKRKNMPEQSNDYRVVVFGAGGVGKSSLVLRFVKGKYLLVS